MAGAGVMRPTVVTAAATPSSRRRLSKVDAGTGNPPNFPEGRHSTSKLCKQGRSFQINQIAGDLSSCYCSMVEKTVDRSPFTLASRGILGNRQWLCPGEVTPNLLVPLIRVAAVLYRAIRFDIGSLVDNENRHRDGQCSPAGVSGGDPLVDRLYWLPEQHYREGTRVFDADAAV